jgi:GTPase SAR1 family protein
MSVDNSTTKPLVVLVVGMAGTGKTTLVSQIQSHFKAAGRAKETYFMNLDPAVSEVPYKCNIDIRDTVNYREVMKQYRLGPNGAILTSLNLFATKFHQVIGILEDRCKSSETPSSEQAEGGADVTSPSSKTKVKPPLKYIFVDTPGQIEVFTWSASGQLIAEAFSSTFPTCMLFVGDTKRCTNPQTFMSTMMYSTSIMYKSQLPLLLALNKCDVAPSDRILQWMKSSDELTYALSETKQGYDSTLTESLALLVYEFYNVLECVSVSAATGMGMDDLEVSLQKCRAEFIKEFLPLLEARKKNLQGKGIREQDRMIANLTNDGMKEDMKRMMDSAKLPPTAEEGDE